MKKALCTLLALLLLIGLLPISVSASSQHLPFTDIDPGQPFYLAVRHVFERDLMQGTSQTTFGPNENLSRAMMTTILHRLAGSPSATVRPVFSDVDTGTWYAEAVTWAYDADLVSGVGRGRFAPGAALTREQLAAMVHRFAVYAGYDVSLPAEVPVHAGTSSWARTYISWANYHDFLLAGNPAVPATRVDTALFLHAFETAFGTGRPLPPSGPVDADYAIWLSVADRHVFPERQVPYTPPGALVVTVLNTGRQTLTGLSVDVTHIGFLLAGGTGGTATSRALATLAPGEQTSFTIEPTNTGRAGYRSGLVTVFGGGIDAQRFEVSFNVLPPVVDIPPAVWWHSATPGLFHLHRTCPAFPGVELSPITLNHALANHLAACPTCMPAAR